VRDDWQRRLAQCFASLLIALTLLPFTAPFPSCDFSTLAATDGPSHDHKTSAAILLSDDAVSHALPCGTLSPRMRGVAMAFARWQATPRPARSLGAFRPGTSPAREPLRDPLSALRI
jgi:hypothetical protein